MCNKLFYWEETDTFRKLHLIYNTDFINENDKFNNWNGEFYKCCKCKILLPKSTYYFASGGINKFHRYCKICEGSEKYGWGRNKQFEFNNNGYYYCSICDRLLPLNEIYFNKTNGKCNKTGYSSNCRECQNNFKENTNIINFSIYSINDRKDFF